MTIIQWNPLVNTDLEVTSYGLQSGYVKTLKYESGKEHFHLSNNFVPTEYQVKLKLDNMNRITLGRNNTEFKQFMYWHNILLRYGMFPFAMPRIFYKGETGIYQFIPETLDLTVGQIAFASFGITEVG